MCNNTIGAVTILSLLLLIVGVLAYPIFIKKHKLFSQTKEVSLPPVSTDTPMPPVKPALGDPAILMAKRLDEVNEIIRNKPELVRDVTAWFNAHIRLPWSAANRPVFDARVLEYVTVTTTGSAEWQTVTFTMGDSSFNGYAPSIDFAITIGKLDSGLEQIVATKVHPNQNIDPDVVAQLLKAIPDVWSWKIRFKACNELSMPVREILTIDPTSFRNVQLEVDLIGGLCDTVEYHIDDYSGDHVGRVMTTTLDDQGVLYTATFYDEEFPRVEGRMHQLLESHTEIMRPHMLYNYLCYKRDCLELALRDCLVEPALAQRMLRDVKHILTLWWRVD